MVGGALRAPPLLFFFLTMCLICRCNSLLFCPCIFFLSDNVAVGVVMSDFIRIFASPNRERGQRWGATHRWRLGEDNTGKAWRVLGAEPFMVKGDVYKCKHEVHSSLQM